MDFLIEGDSKNGIGVGQSEAYEVVMGYSESGSCRISLNSSLKTKSIGTLAPEHRPTVLKPGLVGPARMPGQWPPAALWGARGRCGGPGGRGRGPVILWGSAHGPREGWNAGATPARAFPPNYLHLTNPLYCVCVRLSVILA